MLGGPGGGGGGEDRWVVEGGACSGGRERGKTTALVEAWYNVLLLALIR